MPSRNVLIGAYVLTCIGCFAAGAGLWNWAAAAPDAPNLDATSPEATDPATPPSTEPRRDDPYWRLFNVSLTTGEMADEARRAVSMEEAELERVIIRLHDMVEGSGPRAQLARTLLGHSQRTWEAYMEAQIAMEFPSPDNMRYGSVSFWTIPLRRAGMIQDRVKELKRVLGDGEEEGDVSRPAWPDCRED